MHAHKIPGKDFTIKSPKKQDKGTSIIITDPNTALVRHVVGIFKKGKEQDVQYSNEKGFIHSNLNNCDSVSVVHELFPDVPTLIKTKTLNRQDNYFELTLNPSLAELSFQGFMLTISNDGLTENLPWLFEREQALFIKEGE